MKYTVGQRRLAWLLVATALAAGYGCRSHPEASRDQSLGYFEAMATQIECPDAKLAPRADLLEGPAPWTLRNQPTNNYWDLTLVDATRIALENSQVMRNLGGRLLTTPTGVSTVFDPALQEANPINGTDAALSAFDADLGTTLFYGKNQRVFNNLFFGGGTLAFNQTLGSFQADITKRTAVGTQFRLFNTTSYNRNNSPANLFASAYDTSFGTEFRQPLMRGAGMAVNRIAGPDARPGVYSGVVIARMRTDISLAQFERSVRDLVRDVEQTYWRLHFAYRDLDAKVQGRNAALDTWQVVDRQLQRRIADREQESLARERYFAARAAVENALSGGAESISGGVFAVERQLRLLMGLPTNDGTLIRPADEPMTADMRFEWNDSLGYALTRRVELRQEQWVIKQRELEVTAARNLVLPQLDFVGLYRRNGFGNHLFGNDRTAFDSAMESVLTDGLDDWQIGMELRTPIGNRIGHTALRHAELQLARERAIYRETELQVSHQLSDAMAELDRAYALTRTNYNRKLAAREQVEAVRRKFDAGITPLEFLLDAIRRATEADSAYYRSLVNYNIAVTDVHLARGSLLASHNIVLTEGPWPMRAYQDANRPVHQWQRRSRSHGFTLPPPVSAGPLGVESRESRVDD